MSTAPTTRSRSIVARTCGLIVLVAALVAGVTAVSSAASGAAATPIDINVNGAQVYGSSVTAFAGKAANGAGITGTITCTGLTGGVPISTALTVGTYAIDGSTCSGARFLNAAYTVGNYVNAGYVVVKAPLTLSADSLTKVYGTANPSLTYSVNGFVNGDTSSVLSGAPLLATSATATSAVGSYPIQIAANSLRATNYSISTVVNGALAVTPAPLTVTPSGAQVYGSSAGWAGTTSVSGVTVSGLSCTGTTGGATIDAKLPFGAYTIDGSTCSGGVLSSSNYVIGSYTSTGGFSVLKRGLTVTADPQTRVFGVANPALTYTITGFANGDDASLFTGSPTLSTTAVTTSNVGSYPISITPGSLHSASGSSNYSFTFVPGSLTVTAAPTTVTVTGAQNYGSSSVGFAGSSSVKGVSISGVTCTTVNGGTPISSALPAGTYTIDGSSCGGGSTSTPDYAISSYAGGTFSVYKVALTFTADPQTRVFGVANPALTYTVTGFVNGDDASVLTGSPALATTAKLASDIGSYPIGIGVGTLQASSNYKYVYVNNTLTVTPAPLTVSVAGAQYYGSSAVGFTGTSSVKGVTVTGVTCASVNGGTAIDPTLNFGGYSIDGSSCSGGVLSTPDYAISSYTGGTFTVYKATLTITADSLSRAYGKANPTLTYTATGFVNGDTTAAFTGAPAISTTATTTSAVGSYPITATLGTLRSQNYTFAFAPGTLTVSAQPLTIVTTGAQYYGSSSVAFTGATGVAGVTVSGISCTGTTTGAISSSIAAGGYTIDGTTCSGGVLSSSNYSIGSYAGSTYTVYRVTLTATAQNASKVYGAANPTFTVGFTGFVNGDDASVVSGSPTYSTTATASSGVGSYPITLGAGSLTASNYVFTLAGGTLTVTPATLTVTADDKNRDYATANPTLTATTSGFVNGDTASVVSGAPVLATTATTSSDAGTYPITVAQGTLSATNYTFAFVPGTLTVNPVTPTMTTTGLTSLVNYLSAKLVYGTAKTPIVGVTVTFTQYKTGVPLCTVITNSTGTAVCTPAGSLYLSTLGNGYVISFAGTTDFNPVSFTQK
ncbi:MBG domain-containing protein [Jatrophihabitans sp.]|uniref:beta strand repeat-containing protein n=1 Tax=Jatrophihabitans sp. TaxID=1932789 RepID=UPI0030C738BB|nr:filamentous hemagglutinin family outer membrane protein [Jatrophihabitans sp.]